VQHPGCQFRLEDRTDFIAATFSPSGTLPVKEECMSTTNTPYHILVVEDESGHAELVRRALEEPAGRFAVTLVSTIGEARLSAAARQPDLALVDYQLPDGYGNEIITAHREAFPVVMLTSHGDERLAVLAIKAGALDYVAKSPESFEMLPHVVDRALREWQLMKDRKTAEEALRTSEARLRQLSQAIEQSPVSIIITDTAGVIQYVNPKCIEVTGYTLEEVRGQTPRLLKSGHTRPEEYQRLWATIIAGGEWEGEFHNKKKNGDYFWEAAKISPIIDEAGNITHFLAVKEDITARKEAEVHLRRMEERIRQSEKMEAVGQLAGGIAHDFNNVLGGIIGFTDISLNYVEKDSMLERNLLKVLKAADRAKHLVKQILAFSRQGNPQKTITSIRPIIQEVLDLLSSSIPSSVIIHAELDQTTKPVAADSTQIHQALLNLATNAVQAMNRKGTLTVKLWESNLTTPIHCQSSDLAPGIYTVIEISDTGCGMDAATLSKAFEPFFTTKPVGEGTGMGLSVVLGIVQSHGGDIQVESEVGRGTTVRIFLPAAEDLASRSADQTTRITSTGSERILFVDDEPSLVDMAENILTSLGYTVYGFSDSVKAMEFLEEKNDVIDILITDQTMPVVTGIEIVKKALQIRHGLPVILCTGFSTEVDQESISTLGISLLLMKPYGAHEISKAIRSVLDNPHFGGASI
jgi:PAS domain S-box-containing protein